MRFTHKRNPVENFNVTLLFLFSLLRSHSLLGFILSFYRHRCHRLVFNFTVSIVWIVSIKLFACLWKKFLLQLQSSEWSTSHAATQTLKLCSAQNEPLRRRVWKLHEIIASSGRSISSSTHNVWLCESARSSQNNSDILYRPNVLISSDLFIFFVKIKYYYLDDGDEDAFQIPFVYRINFQIINEACFHSIKSIRSVLKRK